jgi:hypothetical protein
MGEGEQKNANIPKIESGGAGQKKFNKWNSRQQQRAENRMLKEYKAPTPGLEQDLFTVGAASDAADFEEVRKKLGQYTGVNFKQGAVMAQRSIEEMVPPQFFDPPEPSATASPVEVEKWKVKYNELQNEKKAWRDAGPRTCQLLLVHCHLNMEQKLMLSERYLQINQDQNPVELLKLIRSIAHKHEDEKGGTMARVDHNLRLYMCYQKPQMTNVNYYKTFKAIRAVVDVHGGRAGFHEGMFKERLREIKTKNGLNVRDPAMDEMREKAMVKSCNEYLGCMFLQNSDEGRYKQLKSTLDNSYLFGKDDYSTSIEDALRKMQKHKPTQPQKTGTRHDH